MPVESAARTAVLEAIERYLWLGLAGVLLLALGATFVYLFARHNRDWVWAAFRAADAWLTNHAERAWHVIRVRFTPGAWYGLTLTVAVLLILLLILAFAVVTESWRERGLLLAVDEAVHRLVTGRLTPDAAAAVRALTTLGDFLVVFALGLALGGVLLYRGDRWRSLALVVTVAGGEALLWGMKYLFARERPERGLADVLGKSFPSGHAFNATIFYGFVLYIVWRWTSRRWLRVVLTVPLVALILGIAASRVVLRVHWVSDVIGGVTIGVAWLVLSLILVRAAQAWYGGIGWPGPHAVHEDAAGEAGR